VNRLPRFDAKVAILLLIIAAAIFLGVAGGTAFQAFMHKLKSVEGV
jgi:hypothetical protein